ncbi:MAG: TetR/AcrR family transcriptional regulator [Acidimicrobiia bacterium]
MTPDTARRPGRPRSAAADEAIVDAALELFAELGYEGLSMEAVAAEAGVSKATIYRRHPSKSDLVMAACAAVSEQVREPADTGSLRGDLEVIVGNVCRMLTTTVNGRLLPQMVAEAARNDELAAAKRTFVAQRSRVSLQALDRAVERGEISADLDVSAVADLVVGPLFYRHLVSGAPLDRSFQRAHVDNLMRALTS